MKAIISLACAMAFALGLAGCAGKAPLIGKGKAPPVVVTKG